MADTPNPNPPPEVEMPLSLEDVTLGQASEAIATILKHILEGSRAYPEEATNKELSLIVGLSAWDLYLVITDPGHMLAGPLHIVLATALAEQQRRLIDQSLKQSEALAQSSQEMAERSKEMAVEAAKSAKFATCLVVLGIIASLVIGTLALTSSNNWEVRQLHILKSIEQRIPTTQPAKEN